MKRVIQCHGSFATASCVNCHQRFPGNAIEDDVLNQRVPICKTCPPIPPPPRPKKKKNKKFEEGLKELRRRTRETVWQKRKDKEHRHSFGGVEKGPDGFGKQICHECGFSIDVEEF